MKTNPINLMAIARRNALKAAIAFGASAGRTGSFGGFAASESLCLQAQLEQTSRIGAYAASLPSLADVHGEGMDWNTYTKHPGYTPQVAGGIH